MPKKVNKKFLEDMFSKAPQTTLGIKKILTFVGIGYLKKILFM